jgi:hypothetical protein
MPELTTLKTSVEHFVDMRSAEGAQTRWMIYAPAAMRCVSLEDDVVDEKAETTVRWSTPYLGAIGTALTFSIVGSRFMAPKDEVARTPLSRALDELDLRDPLSTAIQDAERASSQPADVAAGLLERANVHYDATVLASRAYIIS